MKKIKLGKLIKVIHGFAFDSSKYIDKSEYRLVTLGNFKEGDNSFNYNDAKAKYTSECPEERFILKEGDLILPLTEQVVGLFGNTAFVPKADDYKFVLNQRVGKIEIISSEVDKNYLHYLLACSYVKKQLEDRASGTKQRNISPDDVYDVQVELPNIETQVKVGELLRSVEDKIAINNAINDNLQQLARTLYEQFFLQYAFATEELIDDKNLSRKRPKSWGIHKAKELFEICLGGTPDTKKVEFWNGDYNWLNSGEIANFPVVGSDLKVSKQGIDNSATKLMPKYSTLVSITGNIRATITAIPTCANQSVVGIMPNNIYHESYIYPIICDLLKYFTTISGGNCQKHINKATIENMFVLVPPKYVLLEYYSQVDHLYQKIYATALESQQLTKIREYLLPLLMNGQITITD